MRSNLNEIYLNLIGEWLYKSPLGYWLRINENLQFGF